MKICQVGAELFHVDGRTDLTKLLVAFRTFANAHLKDGSASSELNIDAITNTGTVGMHGRWNVITLCRQCELSTKCR
jgi:hypothetical protein